MLECGEAKEEIIGLAIQDPVRKRILVEVMNIERSVEARDRGWLLRKSSSSLFLDSWIPGFLIESSR
ncbi:MAG: hypothetical protein JXA90_09155 [Planctomycetes bacterium]|nr:hypothetical protein [Planctomycetota bacterium]